MPATPWSFTLASPLVGSAAVVYRDCVALELLALGLLALEMLTLEPPNPDA